MMQVVPHASEVTTISDEARRAGRVVVLVPTMGALHKGHLALMHEARRHGNFVVVSLFVNPKQFNDPNDFQKYTRDLPGDLKKCETAGVDVVFAPSEEEIYPPGVTLPAVPVPAVGKVLEGVSRPGHFEGVVAVVSRLFRIVRPDASIFGMKDYQQLRVIEEMVKEQRMNIAIIRHPTIRERDGLAMSSRNARLTPEGRQKALFISMSLDAARYLFQRGEKDPATIEKKIAEALTREKLQIDYVAVVDAVTLQKIPRLDRPAVIAIAAFVDKVRLIDNCLLDKTE